MTKPDDTTWGEYVCGDLEEEEEREERWEEFGEKMAVGVRAALEDCELDASRYVVETGHRPSVEADGWQMAEKENVLELRDALRKAGIGDDSVGLFVTPRDSMGEIAELPPENVSVDVEYSVFVNLKQNQEAIDAGARAAEGM